MSESDKSIAKLIYINNSVDKKQLSNLFAWVFITYGCKKAACMADNLKDLGFFYATKAGISLSLEDLRVPSDKRVALDATNSKVNETNSLCERGEISIVEKFQRVVDYWNDTSNTIRSAALSYFSDTDPLNSVYLMANSGARGNISQVRQLVAMRGLMSDSQGQIVSLPIKSNFREGLTITDYLISSYGARKGLVDTALKTADSGYLTRRLVDVAQDLIIRIEDCYCRKGFIFPLIDSENNLNKQVLGRVLLKSVVNVRNGNVLAGPNTVVNAAILRTFVKNKVRSVLLRTPLTCSAEFSVCRFCYGWGLANLSLVDLGDAIGIIAAQSIGEPGTQLTMRTFHTGGAFSGETTKSVFSPISGTISFSLPYSSFVQTRTSHGENVLSCDKPFDLSVEARSGEKHVINFDREAQIFVENNTFVTKGNLLGKSLAQEGLLTETSTCPLISDVSGEVFFDNLTVEEKIDRQNVITRVNKIQGLVWVLSGIFYPLPKSAHFLIDDSTLVNIGTPLVSLDFSCTDQGWYTPYYDRVKGSTSYYISQGCLLFKPKNLSTNPADFYHTPVLDILPFHPEKINFLCKSSLSFFGSGKFYFLGKEGFSSNPEVANLSKEVAFIPLNDTYVINRTKSDIYVKIGDFVNRKTELASGLFSKTIGCIERVLVKNSLVYITVTKGFLYALTKPLHYPPSIVAGGRCICDNFFVKSPSFVKQVLVGDKSFLFVVPLMSWATLFKNSFKSRAPLLQSYYKKGLSFESVVSFPNINVRTTPFNFIGLFFNFLSQSGLNFIQSDSIAEGCGFQLSLLKKLSFFNLSSYTGLDIHENNLLLEPTLLTPGTRLNSYTLSTKTKGYAYKIFGDTFNLGFVEHTCLVTQPVKSKPDVNVKALVRVGDSIGGIRIPISGQVIEVNNDSILIRKGCSYLISANSLLHVNNKSFVKTNDLLATLVYEQVKAGDIIQGLPRVEEVLEARTPKLCAAISPETGYISVSSSSDSLLANVKISDLNSFTIVKGLEKSKLKVATGDFVRVGDPLTEGILSPQDLLNNYFDCFKNLYSRTNSVSLSFRKLQQFLVLSVQNIYKSQGVTIANKHLEVIVKQMTSRVRILEGSDTIFLPGELIPLQLIARINSALNQVGGSLATYEPVLLGITKASLTTESFISAASFQETTRVLTKAAVEGKTDKLFGLKENVILGRLIPSGSGFNLANPIINHPPQSEQKEFSPTLNPIGVASLKGGILKEKKYTFIN